jgi:hypothetical protein
MGTFSCKVELTFILANVTVTEFSHSSSIRKEGYGSPDRNILIKMQQRDRPGREPIPQLPKSVPPPDDLTLAADDSMYLQYFYCVALNFDLVTLPRFVTSFLPQLFGLSLNHYALRQSLMSEAAGLKSLTTNTTPDPCRQSLYRLMAEIYPNVQQAIAENTFDEGHVCAIFQLVKIYVVFGETKGAHRHLQGLRLLIDHLHAKQEPNPLVMSVWRAAIFIDTLLASEGFEYAFPSLERQTDEFHHRWLAKCTQTKEEADLAVAQFALDDIERRVMTAWRLRQSPDTEVTDRRELERIEAGLQSELQQWQKRPAISKSMPREAFYEVEIGVQSFLQYPPLVCPDQRVGLLLMSYHSIYILSTMIVNSAMGPFTPGRFESATTICRLATNITAEACSGTRPGSIHWHIQDLYRVGLVLGEPFHPLGNSNVEIVNSRISMDFEKIADREMYYFQPYGGCPCCSLGKWQECYGEVCRNSKGG